MNINDFKGVFFDCWDTLLEFHMKDKRWNILSLKKHAINGSQIDWGSVYGYTEDFFRNYYSSRLNYEIRIQEILNHIILRFDIRLDCDIDVCAHDILNHLDARPVRDVESFLSFLDERKIPYYCLSNTVYPQSDTKELIEKLIPGHHFSFVMASYEVGVKKPNPLFFELGARKAGLCPEACIYIGDKLYQDCHGSHDAGFGLSVYLNWKDDKERQLASLDKMKLVMTEYLEVRSYMELMEVLNNGID